MLLELDGVSTVDGFERLMPPPLERASAVWVGGSTVAYLSTLKWFTRDNYDDGGPVAVHQKCMF